MEITSFYPVVLTKNFEEAKATYEALGFKLAHTLSDPKDKDGAAHKVIVMKHDNGFRVCIFAIPDGVEGLPTSATWMNVRDFDGACAVLKEHGYTGYAEVRELEYLKAVGMKSPEGNVVVVVYHKRKDDWE